MNQFDRHPFDDPNVHNAQLKVGGLETPPKHQCQACGGLNHEHEPDCRFGATTSVPDVGTDPVTWKAKADLLAKECVEKDAEIARLKAALKKERIDALRHAAELANLYLQSMGTEDGMKIADLIRRDILAAAAKLEETHEPI